MPKTFIKPDIKFPMFPFIYAYIEGAYNKVETYQDFTTFIHGCLNESETTENDVKKLAYSTIANSLYSIETKIAFESKELELLIEKL